MSTVLSTHPDGTLHLSGSLRIYDVEPVCQAVLAHLARHSELSLDLNALTDCDAAGVQFLLAARNSAQSAGKRFRIQAVSTAIPACASALGLSTDLFSPSKTSSL